MKVRDRKSLFLSTTILRGRRLKDDGEGGGAIEVGPGFAEAAANQAGDDTRKPEERGGGATQEIDDEPGEGDGDGEGEGDEGEPDGDPEDDGEPEDDDAKKKRNTADYIRDLKKERRELRRELAETKRANSSFEARLQAIENGVLQQPKPGGNSEPTREKPDPNDAAKYPLGVLDDGYINDITEYNAELKVQAILEARAESERAQADNARAEQHLAGLREKAEILTDAGSDLYDDYEEKVLEAGLRGDWELTETTFTAATEATHGAQILYELAGDKKEAKRVSQLSPYQQMKFVQERDAEIAKTAQPRRKPRADAPPPSSNAPAGRAASRGIRADTDNLNDFRKLWYKK